MNIWLIPEDEYEDRIQEIEESDTTKNTQKDRYYTPDEVLGKVITYDIGGMFGSRFGEIVEASGGKVVAEDLFTRERREFKKSENRKILSLDAPWPGQEYDYWFIEKREEIGGEWEVVKSSPMSMGQVETFIQDPDPDADYRITRREYVHRLDEWDRFQIRTTRDGKVEPTIDKDSMTNPEVYEKVMSSIDESTLPDVTHEYVGELLVKRNYDPDTDTKYTLKWFSVRSQYQKHGINSVSAVSTLGPRV